MKIECYRNQFLKGVMTFYKIITIPADFISVKEFCEEIWQGNQHYTTVFHLTRKK